MPIPHRFVSGGTSAINHIPQLAQRGTRRIVTSTSSQTRTIATSTNLRQFLIHDIAGGNGNVDGESNNQEKNIEGATKPEGGLSIRRPLTTPQIGDSRFNPDGTTSIEIRPRIRIKRYIIPELQNQVVELQNQVVETKPKIRKFLVADIPKSRHVPIVAKPEPEIIPTPQQRQEQRQIRISKLFIEEVRRLEEISLQVHSITDEIFEIRYAKWLEDRGVDYQPLMENTLDALRQHTQAIRAHLSEDVVQKLDAKVEGAVYPLTSHLKILRKQFQEQAFQFLLDAFAVANRVIGAGQESKLDILAIANLADRRVAKQKRKDTWKIVNTAPKWESLGVHQAIEISHAFLHSVERHIEVIRRRVIGGHGPIHLRSHTNLRTPTRWNISIALTIPPVRQGGQRQWFQADPNQPKGKLEDPQDPNRLHWTGDNVLQWKNYEYTIPDRRKKRDDVSIKWYHIEFFSEVNDEGHFFKVRNYTSRKRWEQSNNSRGIVPPGVAPPVIHKYFTGDSNKETVGSVPIKEVTMQNIVINKYLSNDPRGPGPHYKAAQETGIPIRITFNTAPIADAKDYVATILQPRTLLSPDGKPSPDRKPRIVKYGSGDEHVARSIVSPGLPTADDRKRSASTPVEGADCDPQVQPTGRPEPQVQPTARPEPQVQSTNTWPWKFYVKPEYSGSSTPSSEISANEGNQTSSGQTLRSIDQIISNSRSESTKGSAYITRNPPSTVFGGIQSRSFHTSSRQSKDKSVSDPGPRARQIFSLDTKLREKDSPYPLKNRESALRRKLLLEQMERKSSLVALQQGVAYQNTGVTTPPEEMLEEEDYVRNLTLLANGTVEDITETSGMEFMDVGDLIELRTFGGDSELGVFIQPPLQKNGEFLFLTETGKLKTWPTTGMVFTIPKFTSVESAELLRTHIGKLADEAERINPPRQLTKPLTDKIREFHVKALTVFAKKLPILESLYEEFSHETETKTVTTLQATQHAFPDGYENHHVYAVHLALMGDAKRFIADTGRDHKRTGQFEVRSRRDLEVLKKVTEWLRKRTVTLNTGQTAKKHSDIIDSFAQKAAAIIDQSRALRGEPGQNFKPVEAVPLMDLAWTEDEKDIIEFLKFSLERYWFQSSPTKALYPQVLRATERYEDEWMLDIDLLYIFLQEIGVFRPWENPHRFNNRVPLPFHGKSAEEDRLAERVAEVNKDAEAAFQKMGLKDKMEHLREEIPETIYAIDDASAEEIDDGISIVPVSETESWVRVHIANPTAFIEPGSWIGEMAAKQQTTLYLPERTFAMMPRSLVDYKFGLDSDRPTITIAARINNASGDVLEYKIFPGKARTVKRITYNQYNEVIGFTPPKKKYFVVNPQRDPITGDVIEPVDVDKPAHLAEEERKLLTTLREITIALRKKRAKDGSLSFISEDVTVRVNDHPGQPSATNGVAISTDLPILYKGLPTITFAHGTGPTPAHETIAELMLLGGTLIAKFLSSHKVPAPYRAHSLSPRKGTQQIWEEILLPARNEYGLIDKKILREHFNVLGASRLQPFPGAHQLLGIKADNTTGIGGYTKSTSPLRRYTDMLTHYQLEQVLLNLHQGLPVSTNLPFSEQYFAQTLPLIMNHERRIRNIQQNSDKFWVFKLMRWGMLEAKHVPGREHIMPKEFTLKLTTKNQFPAPSIGFVQEFGIPVKVWFKDAKDWENAEWGCIGTADVDETNWSRVKVNMRWKAMLKTSDEVD